MENLSKKKKSSSSSSSFNKLPDDTIFSIIRSGTFMDNLSLLHINRRLRKLFIDYYSRPNILKNLSLSELFTLHKKLQKTKTTQFTVEYNRINDIATNFMENMRISELKKLIKDGTITVAASELIKMKIGLFFGSFNPIHNGHLMVASYIANHSDLKQVWLVVSPQNPHKAQSSL